MERILVIEDDPKMRRSLSSSLRQDQYQVFEAGSVQEAMHQLAANDFDAVLAEQRMGDGDGFVLVTAAREADPNLPVILVIAATDVELAVEGLRQGAFDFVMKPLQPEVVRATVRRSCERTRLIRENILLKNSVVRLEGSSEIYGESLAMQEVRQKIAEVAPTQAPVLITGENGTGKGLVARVIHRNSARNETPFVAVNCAAYNETLLESELFGHEKGAFPGADRQRQGLFEAAHEGTIFLDEAGEMSLAAQAKLLRVLSGGHVIRVGSTRARRVDVRVVVATHRDLEGRVKEGSFREDLFYRLVGAPIHLPALRDRRGDIAGLSDMFSHQIATELKTLKRRLTQEALQSLELHDFPGNLRELKNLIEGAYIHGGGPEISAHDLPLPRQKTAMVDMDGAHDGAVSIPFADSFDLTAELEGAEKALILHTLSSTRGAQAEAARRMGLSRSALAYKLTKYGIRPSD